MPHRYLYAEVESPKGCFHKADEASAKERRGSWCSWKISLAESRDDSFTNSHQGDRSQTTLRSADGTFAAIAGTWNWVSECEAGTAEATTTIGRWLIASTPSCSSLTRKNHTGSAHSKSVRWYLSRSMAFPAPLLQSTALLRPNYGLSINTCRAGCSANAFSAAVSRAAVESGLLHGPGSTVEPFNSRCTSDGLPFGSATAVPMAELRPMHSQGPAVSFCKRFSDTALGCLARANCCNG